MLQPLPLGTALLHAEGGVELASMRPSVDAHKMHCSLQHTALRACVHCRKKAACCLMHALCPACSASTA